MQLTNLALLGRAEQKDIYSDDHDPLGGSADRAIDGNTNGDYR